MSSVIGFWKTSVLQILFHYLKTVAVLFQLKKTLFVKYHILSHLNANNVPQTINQPDECASRTLKGRIAFTFPVVKNSDRLMGAVDIFLVRLLTTTMLEILKECPNDFRKEFMV